MTVSSHGDIQLTDILTGRSAGVGGFAQRPAVRRLAGDDTTTYLAVGAGDGATSVVAVEVEPSLADFITHAFAQTDSGDLAGYRAEILRLAERHVPSSGRADEELQSLYNDAQRTVYEELGQPIRERILSMGLEAHDASPRRSLEGAWPPGYGGSAGCPRFQRSGHNEVWLEAWFGLSHRAWPSPSLDDLVITLVMAIMTEQRQHTLLTRFAPVAPDGTGLNTEIQRILADIDAVIPKAIELLHR